MERGDRKLDRNDVTSQETQRASRPAPGKATPASKLPAGREPVVQRKAAAPASEAPARQARSLAELSSDSWMDAAHRGTTALPADAAVQRQDTGKTSAEKKDYPKVVTIGVEKVNVASADEEKKAKEIIDRIKKDYGIDVSSQAGVDAIKAKYTRVPDAVKNGLVTKTWELKELAALDRALAHFAPILGDARKNSSRKGDAQEVTSVSKVDQAIDRNSASGQLDTTTLGEFFGDSKNFSMFTAGTDKTMVFPDNATELEGTAIHEIAHGLLKHEVDGYTKALEYWTDRSTKSGKAGAEEPITAYGKTNASEDLSEAVMYYFLDNATLKTKCPKRHELIKKMVESWKPPATTKAP
jgi:hypothetical protein